MISSNQIKWLPQIITKIAVMRLVGADKVTAATITQSNISVR